MQGWNESHGCRISVPPMQPPAAAAAAGGSTVATSFGSDPQQNSLTLSLCKQGPKMRQRLQHKALAFSLQTRSPSILKE